jgi:hypothetical protein
MTKEYVCECGRVFDKANSFNGHKSHCTVHLATIGKLDFHRQLDQERGKKAAKTLIKAGADRKQEELELWLATKPQCEKCSKVITEKFGSGRFCSRACANGKPQSEETKQKIRGALAGNTNCSKWAEEARAQKHAQFVAAYLLNPNYCKICGSILPYEQRTNATCSVECKSKLLSENSRRSAEKNGGNNNKYGVRGTAHYGTYKGFHCDSSFELAFVIYCLEHNIPIERNERGFNYVYEAKTKKYYPDFIINNIYIEIKNYWTPQVQAKIDYFPDELQYKILYKEDLKTCIEYCILKYGKDFTNLYDSDRPSWKDRLNTNK